MASRAPFGTDLQPRFDVRVVGGKLVHMTVSHRDKQLSKERATVCEQEQLKSTNDKTASTGRAQCRNTTISGAVNAHKRLKESQRQVDMESHDHRGTVSRSKRSRKMDILPVLQEGTSELVRDPLPQDLTSSTSPQTDHGGHWLPAINVSQSNSRLLPIPKVNMPKTTSNELKQAGDRMKVKELHTLLELTFNSVVNKVGAVKDIQQSCKHGDEAKLGILTKEHVVRVFKSCGARITLADISRLAELTSCCVGSDHILYQKLCTILNHMFTDNSPNMAVDITPTTTATPCGSVGSYSPVSVEDYDSGHTLPMLVDKTNSPQLQPLRASNRFPFQAVSSKSARLLKTHPLSKSQSKPSVPRLPPISDAKVKLDRHSMCNTNPTVEHKMNAEWPLLLGEQEAQSVDDGIEKMHSALMSCTDSEGLLESEHANRVVQNYNLIYKLGLPLHQIKYYMKVNTLYKENYYKPYVVTDTLLKYLSSLCVHS